MGKQNCINLIALSMDSVNIASSSLALELLAGFACSSVTNTGTAAVMRALDYAQKIRQAPCRFSVFINIFSFSLHQYLLFKSKDLYWLLVFWIL